MARLSDRVLELKEAATLKMAQLARDLRAQGKDIVSLTIGEPDFDTPEHIREAAKTALDEGYTRYTPVPGYPELREAICRKFARDNDLNYEPGQIVVSTGAKQSLANVCLALLNPGDEAVFLAPYWVSYYEMARLAGATPVVIKAGVEQDFKITAEQLAAAITDKTRMIMLNTPCNPTGSVYSRDELAAIAAVVAQHDELYVVSDEIYEHITFDQPHVSIATLPDMHDRVITVNGMSKGFAMTGWRVGYMGAPTWIAKAATKIQGQFTSGTNSIAQRASIAALDSDRSATHAMRDAYRRRRDIVHDLLARIPGLKINNPQGAFYFFPDATSYYGRRMGEYEVTGSVSLCELFLHEGNIALVPGEAFGDDNCFRISCAASEDQLREGIARIARVLNGLRSS